MRNTKDINSTLTAIKGLLEHIDPDVGYNDWIRVLMVIFNETDGHESGFSLADHWSGQGYKYKGEREIRAKWRGFKLNSPHKVRMGTLIRIVALHS